MPSLDVLFPLPPAALTPTFPDLDLSRLFTRFPPSLITALARARINREHCYSHPAAWRSMCLLKRAASNCGAKLPFGPSMLQVHLFECHWRCKTEDWVVKHIPQIDPSDEIIQACALGLGFDRLGFGGPNDWDKASREEKVRAIKKRARRLTAERAKREKKDGQVQREVERPKTEQVKGQREQRLLAVAREANGRLRKVHKRKEDVEAVDGAQPNLPDFDERTDPMEIETWGGKLGVSELQWWDGASLKKKLEALNDHARCRERRGSASGRPVRKPLSVLEGRITKKFARKDRRRSEAKAYVLARFSKVKIADDASDSGEDENEKGRGRQACRK